MDPTAGKMIVVVGNCCSGPTMMGWMLGLHCEVYTFGEIYVLEKVMTATEWIVTMREGLHLLDTHLRDVLRVSYEAPAATCQPIAEFGLPTALDAPFRQTIVTLRLSETL